MKIFWRFAPWLSRIILILPTLIFTLIALKYLAEPAQAAREVGISLDSPLGATILRVGFGAFPLGCGVFTFGCLISKGRVSTGLSFVATIVGVILIVRIYGMLVDGTVQESMVLIRPEVALLVLCFIGMIIESSRRRHTVHSMA
jgi:hypothetical protein